MFAFESSLMQVKPNCKTSADRIGVGRVLVGPPPPRGQVANFRRTISFDANAIRIGDRIGRLTVIGNVKHRDGVTVADVVCECGTFVDDYKMTGDRWQGMSCGCHVAWSPLAAKRGAYRADETAAVLWLPRQSAERHNDG